MIQRGAIQSSSKALTAKFCCTNWARAASSGARTRGGNGSSANATLTFLRNLHCCNIMHLWHARSWSSTVASHMEIDAVSEHATVNMNQNMSLSQSSSTRLALSSSLPTRGEKGFEPAPRAKPNKSLCGQSTLRSEDFVCAWQFQARVALSGQLSPQQQVQQVLRD